MTAGWPKDGKVTGNGLIPEEGLNRMLAEALVDREFRRKLLADPCTTSQRFDLTDEQRFALSAIRANTLSDLAGQLLLLLSNDGHGNRDLRPHKGRQRQDECG